MKLKCFLLFFILAIFIQSCSFLPFKLQKVQVHFPSIKQVFTYYSPKDIRILIFYEICLQKENYAKKFKVEFKKKLGEDIEVLKNPPPITNEGNLGKIKIANLKIEEYLKAFYAILWSWITELHCKILSENHSEIYVRKALLRNILKQSISNDRHLDFIIFTSYKFKGKITKSVYETLN